MIFQTKEFILDIEGDWERRPGDSPEQHVYESQDLKTEIVASYILAAVPHEKMLEAAQAAAQSALDSLEQGGPHRLDEGFVGVLDVQPPTVHWKLTGRTTASIFRWEGWVTSAKFLNIWVGVESDDEAHAARILDGVFGGFNYYAP